MMDRVDQGGAPPPSTVPHRTYLPERFMEDFAEAIQCLYVATKDYCGMASLHNLFKRHADHSLIAPQRKCPSSSVRCFKCLVLMACMSVV